MSAEAPGPVTDGHLLGHWHEGITAEDMASLVWGHPVLIARAAFTEWTAVCCATHACYI